jgi:3-hydroxypropanoate dehydrogenase
MTSERPIARESELALLFTAARTHSAWLDHPVDDALLVRLHELARMPPTGGNSQPMRVVFVRSAEAKQRLRPALNPGNVDKTMAAPVTAIIAFDTEFHDLLPRLNPVRPESRERMASLPAEARDRLAMQSANLQAGYLMLAARALGLDCGPMGGFDPAQVDAAFFPDTTWRSLLLINLGHGDPSRLHPQLPRLAFDEACRLA